MAEGSNLEGSELNEPMAKPVNSGPQKSPATRRKVIAILILGLLGLLGIGGYLIGLQVQSSAKRVLSENNVRVQILAIHNYESSLGVLPKQGSNGLSWRVHILPFLKEEHLYKRFNLDEPWDSPNNIQLITEMPDSFFCQSLPDLPTGFTIYQVPYTDLKSNPEVETSALFDNTGNPISLDDVTDGSSNTIAIIEVDATAAVEWTKPVDWEYKPSDPMHDLGNVHPGVIVVAMADAVTSAIPANTPPEEFKAMITRNGGE